MRANSSVPVLYPNHYTWLVFVSALDVMLTWVVLWSGGREANVLAHHVINTFGLPGLVAFKFALVLLVIVICETIGRRSDRAGRRFAMFAIAFTCLPVVMSFVLLGSPAPSGP